MRREIAYNDLARAAEVSAQESLFVLRLKANEDAAYDELVRTYNASIFHVAYRMLGDTAEADKAIAGLNGKQLDGRALNINEAKPKTEGGGGGGARRTSRW